VNPPWVVDEPADLRPAHTLFARSLVASGGSIVELCDSGKLVVEDETTSFDVVS
jgi:hypothetical protein